eukprot:jgi/Tetstr1/442796/TSEL_030880.t1
MVHHTMSLLDEVNRTLDNNSTESLVDFLDRKWEAIQAYDAATERAISKPLKIKYPGDSHAKASTIAALAAFEDDNTAAVTDQSSDDTDAGDELTLEEEGMLLSGVFVKVPDGTRKKLDSKAWTGIFVGYHGNAPGWMVLNPATCRVTVRFSEDESGFAPDPRTDSSIILEAEEEQPTVEMDLDEQQEHPEQTAISDYASYPLDPSGESNMQQTVALLSAAGIPTPRNFKEAMSPEFRDLWEPAIHKGY